MKNALKNGQKPEIFNTDQGSQFTDNEFVKVLIDTGISISMEGKGRALDNIFRGRPCGRKILENDKIRGYLPK